MTRIGEILEPGERIVLQHWPRLWVYAIAGLLAAADLSVLGVVGWFVVVNDAPDGMFLMLVTAGFVALMLVLLPPMVGLLRVAVVTDRRVLVRDGMTWANPKQIRCSDIEVARQNGGRFEIRSVAKTVEFPSPPQFARGILAALGREADGLT